MQQEAQVRALIARERQAAIGVMTQLSSTSMRSQGSMISSRPAVTVHAVAGESRKRGM